jgi:hypothetical protein
MQAQSVAESNFGTKLVNKGDSVQQLQYTFTGLSEVYENIMMDVSGAARIPVTKLFGRSPAGLNATGESDMRNYYDFLEEVRESEFRPIIEKLLPVMALSAWGEIPDDLDFIFESMWSSTENEKADIVRKNVSSLIEAFNAGGMDQSALMKELRAISTTTGIFVNITDEMTKSGEGVWAWDLKAMNDPFAGLMAGGSVGGFGDGGDDFERNMQATDYDPNQPREPDGKFGNGGGITSEEEKQKKIDSIAINENGDSLLPRLNKETIEEYGLLDTRQRT